ncbi:MAG: ferrous iron transport protein A [Clostridia bacterium]|nr:ferrous iron transport protein A [Clostridia bacterium]
MSLLAVNSGQSVILKDIDWGKKLKKKLQDMGMTPGVRINMIQKPAFGPCVVEVRGTRLALGRGIVSKIFVDLI